MTQITPFEQSPHAPYPLGGVPAAGWYCIETAYDHPAVGAAQIGRALGYDIPDGWNDDQIRTHAEQHGYAREIATPEHLSALASNFDAANAEGRGLLVTINHSTYHPAENTRAAGWIKALHAAGDCLWAWIEWTPWGHAMVNNGEFVFFSTEYLYTDFAPVPGGVTPRLLHACTLTNNNRHKGQVPATNTSTPKNNTQAHMKTNTAQRNQSGKPATKTARRNSDCKPGEEETAAANSEENPDEEEQATANSDENPDEEEQAATNEGDGEMTLESAVIGIAEELVLPETATPAELLGAVRALQTSNSELQKALAEANKAAGTATNSARYPGLFGQTARLNTGRQQAALKGHDPARQVRVNTARGPQSTDAQQIALVDYRNKALATAAQTKGSALTPGEYTSVSTRATREFYAGENR